MDWTNCNWILYVAADKGISKAYTQYVILWEQK